MTDRPDAIWTPLDAAASALGISADAARKRLERGTLTGEKRDGRWFVRLEPDAAPDAMSGQPDATWTPPVQALVDQLRSENAYLRRQVEEAAADRQDADRRHAAELERRDILLREALERIPHQPPALVPGPPTASPQAPESTEPTAPAVQAPRSWWRRIVGSR